MASPRFCNEFLSILTAYKSHGQLPQVYLAIVKIPFTYPLTRLRPKVKVRAEHRIKTTRIALLIELIG